MYEPGDYYYIDVTVAEDGKWVLSEVNRSSLESGNVEFHTRGVEGPFDYGKLQMGLDNAPAFSFFNREESFSVNGRPVFWDVKFSFAESSDD
jgi:hypothetical protein